MRIPLAYNNEPSTLSVANANRVKTLKGTDSSSNNGKYYKISGLITSAQSTQATYIITTRLNENYYLSTGTDDLDISKVPSITRMHNSYSKIAGFTYKNGILYIKSVAYNNSVSVANLTNTADLSLSVADATEAEYNSGTAVPIMDNINSSNYSQYTPTKDEFSALSQKVNINITHDTGTTRYLMGTTASNPSIAHLKLQIY